MEMALVALEPPKSRTASTTSGRSCGAPRRSEPEAEQYLAQLRHGPNSASAYRLVYAFTDHNVTRVWGTPALRQQDLL
ncbi:hypothetical protein ACWC0C_47775 [Streptomyces sp. NPDC001709]